MAHQDFARDAGKAVAEQSRIEQCRAPKARSEEVQFSNPR